MNIMNRLTWKSMLENRTRTIVTIIGIVLSAALFCGITTLGASILSYLIDLQIAVGGDYYVSATVQSFDDAEDIKKNNYADSIAEAQILGVSNFFGFEFRTQSGMIIAGDRTFYQSRPSLTAKEGRLPQNSSEIAIDECLMQTLRDMGYPTELGSKIELPVTPYIEAMQQGDPNEEVFTVAVTLVGIVPQEVYDTAQITPYDNGYLACIYTTLDENTPDAIYHDLYLKTATPFQALNLATEVGGKLNYDLLQYYGISKAYNITVAVLSIVSAVIVVIMLGTVSMISNAFSISVSQRTKEFGLLSSVGATRKQLRKSVQAEATILCILGIPLGLLLGFVATALLLKYSGSTVESMLATTKTGIMLTAMANPVSFLSAALISAATVFLSALLPSRRATKITPLDAIRQAKDYNVAHGTVRASQKRWEMGRISANMAKKYYRTSRKKYRSIVAALAVSVVLFMSASGISIAIGAAADIMDNSENYDFIVSVNPADSDNFEQLRNHKSVSHAVLRNEDYFHAIILDSYESEERQSILASDDGPGISAANFWRTNTSRMYYLEDDAFRSFLEEYGVDPAPYFDAKNPLAVVFCHETIISKEVEENKWENYHVNFAPFKDSVASITLTPDDPDVGTWIKEQIKAQGYDEAFPESGGYDVLPDGRMVYRAVYAGYNILSQGDGVGELIKAGEDQTFTFLAVDEMDEDGTIATRFYLFDEATGTTAKEATAQIANNNTTMGIGAQIYGVPYGLPQEAVDFCFLTMLRPLSMCPVEQTDSVQMCISTKDYQATIDFLNHPPAGVDVGYYDCLGEQYQMRQIKKLIDVFSYTFAGVMMLICVANVFNTISTNILLRRKDFGMLRSLGMSNRNIRAMVAREILTCGFRALCWSLPVGLCLNITVQLIVQNMAYGVSAAPWASLAVAIGIVLVVMGSSMFYALTRIRKDNPIDAIRMENT